ncbi:MAG TPA: DUF1028 domain-containing protein, partial [Acidobacteriota bacterium]
MMTTRYLVPERLGALTLVATAILATGVAPAAQITNVAPAIAAQADSPALAAAPQRHGAEDLPPPVATFSILAYDPETGMLGAAVQSRVFSVGNGVLWGEANTGVVATQAVVDVSYGPQALELLRQGMAPADIVETIWERDPDPGYRGNAWSKAGRQFSVMNARGQVATFTGPEASEWAGHVIGENSSAQGNILAGPEVVQDMVSAFESTEGHLAVRLLAALEAGQAAGGDRRGMQSAAMLIVQEDGGVWLNNDVVLRLQVDDSPQPIDELRRLVARALRGPARQGLQTTAIVNGRLFDGTGAAAIDDGVVLFEDDRITAVGPATEIEVPGGARRIDAGGGMIMPGVIDNHMHALWPGSPLTTAGEDTMTPWLQAGVTTLVDTGSIRH